ncbi:isoprenylcysteine carboxylmethyltransferase family protein [Methanosarcina sp.]|uniref:methyltransferase family protein n=1 Tax=Methanosarcina sp. TaxID=2213 RepID=UPI002AB9CA86|nr:isoprenylcysteine carboxylmethyltransferase family protein [Methanosarcina sp.]MDY9927998.1 isoprenylcysteine carboxylmethyltransferase family protein [Methanosarcina sp.]
MSNIQAYGLWPLVIINSLIFIVFALSFTQPKISRDWRSLGGFAAFIVALFTEMYGFPLTIYLLSGWLTDRYPGLDIYSHNSGHLWSDLLGTTGDPHFSLIHIFSYILILGGLYLLSSSWSVLYKAQKSQELATSGPYAYVRHPQYVAFVLVMIGFLIQWPTILTLIMFPILVWVYKKLARREERDTLVEFGEEYSRYMAKIPGFIPHFG